MYVSAVVVDHVQAQFTSGCTSLFIYLNHPDFICLYPEVICNDLLLFEEFLDTTKSTQQCWESVMTGKPHRRHAWVAFELGLQNLELPHLLTRIAYAHPRLSSPFPNQPTASGFLAPTALPPALPCKTRAPTSGWARLAQAGRHPFANSGTQGTGVPNGT